MLKLNFNQIETNNLKVVNAFPDILQNIYSILITDSKENLHPDFAYFKDKNYWVINGDKLEQFSKIKENEQNSLKSVDLIFAIDNEGNSNLVLIELKLNVISNFRNIKSNDIIEKFECSKKRLGDNIKFYTEFYLVFNENIVPEAVRKIKSLFSNFNQFKVISHKNIQPLFFA